MIQKRMLMVVLVAVLFVGLTLTVLPAGKADAVVKLKVAHYFPGKTFQAKTLEQFCRDLEKRTNGKVKVDFFAGGSLLKAPAMFDGVVDGIADIGYSHVYYTPGRFLVTEATGLPVGYPTGWVASHVMNDFYLEFKPKEFNKVKVLFFNASPNSAIATKKKAIRSLEDLKGLKIRAPGLPGEVIKALGGTPAPTPMMEVYDAISKGVIDGETSNFETLAAFKFAEVVKYSTSIGVNFPYPFYLVMNKNSYAKLPADVKPIFNQLVGEYREKYILMWNSIDFFGKGFGLKKGVKIIELPPEEVKRWQAAVAPVLDNYVKKMVGKGYSEMEVKGWIKFMQDRSAYWAGQQKALRIPSAVGPPELKPEALIMK